VIDDAKKRLESGENPMNLKRELGRIIVKELCGKEEVTAAEEFFQKTVVEKKVDENAPEVKWEKGTMNTEDLIKMIVDQGMAASNGEAKRLIEQGGVYLNEVRVEKGAIDLSVGDGVLRVGKRKYIKIVR
jgi:tyrosyl-tRNA synthetase